MLLRTLLLVLPSIATSSAAVPVAPVAPDASAAISPNSPPSLKDTATAYLFAVGAFDELLELQEKRVIDMRLERFPLSDEIPEINILKRLWDHGYKYFSRKVLFQKCCEKGLLRHLEFLIETPSVRSVVPSSEDFVPAAVKGHLNVLEWGFKKEFIKREDFYEEIAIALAINGHADYFGAWLKMTGVLRLKGHIIMEGILKVGTVKAVEDALLTIGDPKDLLQYWLVQRELGELAKEYFPALMTLLKLLPSHRFKDLKTTGRYKIQRTEFSPLVQRKEGLVHHWEENVEFLQIIEEKTDIEPLEKAEVLKWNACTEKAMIWLKETKGLCPDNMDWPYAAGDKGAIEWARKNCPKTPHSDENFKEAVKRGHLEIVEGINKDWLRANKDIIFWYALINGNLKVFDYLQTFLVLALGTWIGELEPMVVDQHLPILKRAWDNGCKGVKFTDELERAVRDDDVQTAAWILEKEPMEFHQFSTFTWPMLFIDDRHKVYEYFLQIRPRDTIDLSSDFQEAFCQGNLRVVMTIAAKNPEIVRTTPRCDNYIPVSRYYHVVEWLKEKGPRKKP